MKTDEIKIELQDMIRARVQEFGLSQTDAANMCGLPKSRISEIFNHRTSYGVDNLMSVLDRLGVKVGLELRTIKQTKGLPRL